MYIKIINPSLHGKTTFSNSGSCKNLIDYLSKENEKLPLDEKELFFNHQEAELSSNAVLKLIDNNTKGIAKGRTKFHSLVIAPDPQELKHIKHSLDALKQYTCEVMKVYAQSFKLKDGKVLDLDNLVWAAKLERERNGEQKDGSNMHIHVIVSARDKDQKISLSPNVNDKQRFNRVQFCMKSEQTFDKLFHYQRTESKLQTDQIRKYGTLAEKEQYFSSLETSPAESQSIPQKKLGMDLVQPLIDSPHSNAQNEAANEPDYKKRKVLRKKKRNKGPKL